MNNNLALKTTFNSAAERYHARRPNYPPGLFEKLVIDTHLPKHAELLEIGPGTGQATKPLAERGYNITAVELGDALAAKAREVLADYPNADVITGAFEDVELPAEHYDLVYSATAIHWIKPEFKFAKPYQLLKTNGYLAIIHTAHVSDEAGDKFFHASWPIYRKYDRTDTATDTPGFELPKLEDLQPPEKIDENVFSLEGFTVFPLTASYSSQEYIELLATYSPHLSLSEEKRAAFLKQIKELIDTDFGGHMDTHYGMTLTVAKKK